MSSFIKEITVNITALLQTTTDSIHQADTNCRDQAFQEDIYQSKIQILKQPQATTVADNCGY
jgi:hypothetical protein